MIMTAMLRNHVEAFHKKVNEKINYKKAEAQQTSQNRSEIRHASQRSQLRNTISRYMIRGKSNYSVLLPGLTS